MKTLTYLALITMAAVTFAQSVSAATVTQSGQINDVYIDEVFAGVKIAQLSFRVTESGIVTIDSNNTGFDSDMVLYNSDGDNIAFNADDPRVDPLDYIEYDSYLSVDLDPGVYMVALGPYFFSDEAGLLGYDAYWGFDQAKLAGWQQDSGTYELIVTGSVVAVPLPAGLPLFLSALVGLGIIRRK